MQKAPALCLPCLPFLLVWCASLVAGSRRLAIVILLSRYLLLLQKIDWWEPKTIDSLFPKGSCCRPIIKIIKISQDGFMTSAKASIMYNFFLKAGQLMPFPGPHVYDSRGLKKLTYWLTNSNYKLRTTTPFSISLLYFTLRPD